jgi:UDP-N-acetylglucosamine 4,6-dehydratase/5-epimerase
MYKGEPMKQILLTGAGSLGEAFIRLLHTDNELTVIDNCEWTIARLQKQYPDVKFILDDFANWKFNQYPVDYIIHTAAYKHLPLGEENPSSFIDNNIIKLRTLFEEAYNHGVELLFVSTDKAVEPTSLYGFTKAIGESLAKHYEFSIARMGNILNSSGSVIPVWEKAIDLEQPIPITDERMTRYFIEDYEAANQLWHEFIQGKKLIIPKCQKMRLLDLLGEVLKRKGYSDPSEYEFGIIIIGMREGEKLDEKLMWEGEDA